MAPDVAGDSLSRSFVRLGRASHNAAQRRKERQVEGKLNKQMGGDKLRGNTGQGREKTGHCSALLLRPPGMEQLSLAAWLTTWLPDWPTGRLAARLPGCMAAWLPGCLAAWLPSCLSCNAAWPVLRRVCDVYATARARATSGKRRGTLDKAAQKWDETVRISRKEMRSRTATYGSCT